TDSSPHGRWAEVSDPATRTPGARPRASATRHKRASAVQRPPRGYPPRRRQAGLTVRAYGMAAPDEPLDGLAAAPSRRDISDICPSITVPYDSGTINRLRTGSPTRHQALSNDPIAPPGSGRIRRDATALLDAERLSPSARDCVRPRSFPANSAP